MNIFDNVDIDFFSLKDEQPKDQENIVIVLKAGVDSGNPRPYPYRSRQTRNPVILTDKVTLDFATYYTLKTRENVFRTKSAYRRRRFTSKDIICWGRLV